MYMKKSKLIYPTYYFITDFRKMSQDNFLKLELMISKKARKFLWKLFEKHELKTIGKIYLSLN